MYIVWVICMCLFDKQIEANQAFDTAEWSVSLSNVVVISARTKTAAKTSVMEFEPGLVFKLVENSVRIIYRCFFVCLYDRIIPLRKISKYFICMYFFIGS